MTDDFAQFGPAMWDAFKAAMIGLNPVPAVVLSLLIGMGQATRTGYVFKAAAAVVPAVIIASLWPLVYNDAPIWPDLGQIEAQIQVVMLLVVSYVIIRLVSLIKTILSLGARQPKKA